MITPELIAYIRGEFAKGKTREEIHKALVAQGGWTEEDMNEAFRTVIPLQGFVVPKTVKKVSWQNIIFVVVGIAIVALWWLYRPQISTFLSGLQMPSFEGLKEKLGMGQKEDAAPVAPAPVTPVPETPAKPPEPGPVKDCGSGDAPNMKDPRTYQNSTVLNCLGAEALSCFSGARAVLKDPLFPTIFEIINNKGACNFKLSYAADSTLVDISGNKLAGQYINCPLSIVKRVDETKATPVFAAPSTENMAKYAGEIYFYGTLGVFMEQDVDKAKIESLGCDGPFISSVVASYQKLKAKK